MKKFRITIDSLAPEKEGGNIDIAKFEFYAKSEELAYNFKDEITELFDKSPNPFKEDGSSPRTSSIVEITTEGNIGMPFTLGADEW